MRRLMLSASLLALAACARTEEASLVPAEPEGYNTVEPVRTPEQDDGEVALGEWRQTLQEEQRALEFGPMGAPPLFSLRCDERRGLLLQRHGAAPVGDLPMMLVSVGSETRRLPVTAAGGTIPMIRASIPPSDNLVATLASSEQPITIRIGDSVPLILPPSPLVGAFVESCASGEAATPMEGGGEAAPANQAAPAEEAQPG